MLKFLVLLGLVLCVTNSSQAQAKVELFGGYSYFRPSVMEGQFTPGTPCPPNCTVKTRVSQNANLNGWHFLGQYKFLPFFGGVVDFNGTYGKLNSISIREHTFLVGPQVSLPLKVSPFAHALFGLAHESQSPTVSACVSVTCTGFISLGSSTSWATAVGGGLDWHVAPFVAVRVFQIDSVHTNLHGVSQDHPRVSAGIVFHF